MAESSAFWESKQNDAWSGPYYGFEQVDFVIGEAFASTRSGHYAHWLRTTHPESVRLYEAQHALDGLPPADLPEVWQAAIPAEQHYNSWIANKACTFLQHRDKGRPFLMYVSFPDPHHPFTPPKPYCDHYDPAAMPLPRVVNGELEKMPRYIRDNINYNPADIPEGQSTAYADVLANPTVVIEQGALQTTDTISEDSMRKAIAHTYGCVEMIDDAIGRILKTLDQQGLTEQTLLIFTSDHGEMLGDHGLIRKGPPPYRQVLQVPLIIKGPGVKEGTAPQRLTTHLDIKATVLDYLKASGDGYQGKSLAPLLTDEQAQLHSELFAEYHPRAVPQQYNHTIITSKWRLTLYPLSGAEDWGEFFDRINDPHEHNNLYHHPDYQAQRQRLTQRLKAKFPAQPEVDSEILGIW